MALLSELVPILDGVPQVVFVPLDVVFAFAEAQTILLGRLLKVSP